jgi:mRNA-degrading endonuclease toxin of MazEF toxin-antitoxin module
MLTIEKYDNWWIIKKELNFWEDREFFINNREVWYISVWANIWNEVYWKSHNFKRPVLVIKKVWNLFFCVSLTTKWKISSKFNFHLDKKYFSINNSFINLSQIKTYDKKRFIENIWTIDEEDFNKIKKDLKKLLF